MNDKNIIEQENNENEPIDQFKKIFDGEIEKKEEEKKERKGLPRYIVAIILYVVFTLFLSTILILILIKADPKKYTKTPLEDISSQVINDDNAIGILNKSDISDLSSDLYVYNINDIKIAVINTKTKTFENLLKIDSNKKPINETLSKKTILDIISIKDYKIKDNKINIYTKADVLSDSFKITNTHTISPNLIITDVAQSTVNFISYIFIAIAVLGLLYKDLAIDFKKLKKLKWHILTWVVVGFIAIYLLNFFNALYSQLFQKIFNYAPSAQNQDSVVSFLKKTPVMMTITAVILAPVVEELIFRKSIIGLFKNKKIGVVVAVASFALIHLIPEIIALDFLGLLHNIFSYLLPSIALTFVYMKSNKNIYIPMSIHMLSNLISVIVVFTL